MFYIDGVPHYQTKDFKPFAQAFRSAVAVNGWQHESQGVWRGDKVGNNGLTLAEWFSRQKLIRTASIVNTTGFTRQYISKVANDNELKPVSKGRWRVETVGKLLQILGRLTRCPKCKGVAGMDKQGEVICLDCD